MHADRNTIAGVTDIDFEVIRAIKTGLDKCREGIFRTQRSPASMGDQDSTVPAGFGAGPEDGLFGR